MTHTHRAYPSLKIFPLLSQLQKQPHGSPLFYIAQQSLGTSLWR